MAQSTSPQKFSSGAAVEVLVDETGRLGSLSYLVPAGLEVFPGDAVHVPFGKRELHGLVLGPAPAPTKATREIIRRYGQRSTPELITLATRLATWHFTDLTTIAPRLAPRHGRGAEPLEVGEVRTDPKVFQPIPERPERATNGRFPGSNQLWLLDPLINEADAAVSAALQLLTRAETGSGQVLILCPTEKAVTAVLSRFSAGAARLDARSKAGAWSAFIQGSLPIAVATRTAALYHAPNLLGLVLVNEEHPGHIEPSAPYTHVRDIVLARAKQENTGLIILSSAPTAAALGAGVSLLPVGSEKYWPSIKTIPRVDDLLNSSDPALDLLDTHAAAVGALPPRRRSLIPTSLIRAVVSAADKGVKPLVLVQSTPARRVCRSCAAVRPCGWCKESTCTHIETAPCPSCGGSEVRMSGWDAPRVEEIFRGKVRAVTLAQLQQERDASLVIIFDATALGRAASLHPASLLALAILTAARAAGAKGTVLICTEGEESPLLQAFIEKDLLKIAKLTWASAEKLYLPPFAHLLTITSPRRPNTSLWPGVIHGPRKVGPDWEVAVRVTAKQLEDLRPILLRFKRGGKVRIRIQ